MSDQDDEELDESVDIKIEQFQDTTHNEANEAKCDTQHFDPTLQSLVNSIHMEIKQELNDTATHTIPDHDNTNIGIKLEIVTENGEAGDLNVTEGSIDVKQEVDEGIVSYDIPQFDSSLDASEEGATCPADIHEPYNIKSETNESCEEIANVDIKLESDVTVTETNLVPNKSPRELPSFHRDSLVMAPMHLRLLEHQDDDEEILPTLNTNYDKEHLEILEPKVKIENCDNGIQLNSITGDVLPLEAYTEHKRSFNCPKCPKVCTTAHLLQRHLGIHQTIQNYEIGRERAKRTRRANQRKRAKVSTEEPTPIQASTPAEYRCTCGGSFRRRSRMESCMRSHDMFSQQNQFSCQACKTEFKDKQDLSVHRKLVHNKKFPCKFCPTDHKSRKDLFKHLRLHQKSQLVEFKIISELVEGKVKLKCFECNNSFAELMELKAHVLRDHTTLKCPNCVRVFTKIADLVNHVRSHDKVKALSLFEVFEAFAKLAQSWRCDECSVQFYHTDDLALHQRMHSKSVREPKFRCDDCRRVFVTAKSLNVHRRIHHNVTEQAQEENGLLCVHCRKVCADDAALSTHMRFHATERKFVCKFCDFRFASAERRKSHAEIHTGDMRYVCFICEYRCSSENRLKNHKKSPKHLSMKDFLLNGAAKPETEGRVLRSVSCDICGETFSTESGMLSHKQTHPFIEFPNEDRPTRIFFK